MTITWIFNNNPEEYFELRLDPSIADYIFSFNVGIRTPGDSNWLTASKEMVVGKDAVNLKIAGKRNQEALIIVRDRKGTEHGIKLSPAETWIEGGHIATTQQILEYREKFESSLGISKEEMYCMALLEEYQSLEATTHLVIENYKPGQKIHGQQINTQDLLRRKVLAKELVGKCENYFKNQPDQWYELEQDARD